MFNGKNKAITFSYDDAVTQDIRLIEILNKICGFDMSKADYLRREIAKAKRGTTKDVEQILTSKYGEKGQELFEYIIKVGRYTVSKAYVLANLHVLIEY